MRPILTISKPASLASNAAVVVVALIVHNTVAGFNELRIKDKLIKEIVIKESAKKIQVINDVGKKGI